MKKENELKQDTKNDAKKESITEVKKDYKDNLKKDTKEVFETKNLIIVGIFVVSIIIILFGGALIYNKFFYKKSYNEVEEIMVDAALEYLEKYEKKLPQNVNDAITLKEDTLVSSGLINSIDSYVKSKDGNTCTGEVKVTKIGEDKYRYIAFIDCGENIYQTKSFNDYVNENVEIVSNGDGLYSLNNELVYRGDQVNNYIKLGGKIYRIVKIQDGTTVVIFTDKSTSTNWDDRYNIEKDDFAGINNYETSRIRTYLNNLYKSTGEDAFLSNSVKLLVTQYDLPIGKRSNSDTDKTGSLEKAMVLTEQYIGLLPISDFLNASLDVNCTTTVSKSCFNYNYLSKYKYAWWTSTANSKNTYKVYRIDGVASTVNASGNAYVRPVLHLAKDIVYVSGDGSYNKPFIVK